MKLIHFYNFYRQVNFNFSFVFIINFSLFIIKIKPKTKKDQHSNNMSDKKIKNLHIQVNATLPEQFHIISPKHNHQHQHQQQQQFQQQIQPIQQENVNENQDIHSSPHKIVHIEVMEDKGEFIDSDHKIRGIQTQIKQQSPRNQHTIHRDYSRQMDLQEIGQKKQEQSNVKPLKHLKMNEIEDHDEFNTSQSRIKQTQRKRRLSESNLQKYIQHHKNQEIQQQLARLNKTVPFQIIQQEQTKKSNQNKRERRNSVHSLYKVNSGVSDEYEKMIVDEVDKRKNRSNKKQEDEPQQMQAITQQKQQDEQNSLIKLQKSIDKIQNQISELSNVVGNEVGPQASQVTIGYVNATMQGQSIKESSQYNS